MKDSQEVPRQRDNRVAKPHSETDRHNQRVNNQWSVFNEGIVAEKQRRSIALVVALLASCIE